MQNVLQSNRSTRLSNINGAKTLIGMLFRINRLPHHTFQACTKAALTLSMYKKEHVRVGLKQVEQVSVAIFVTLMRALILMVMQILTSMSKEEILMETKVHQNAIDKATKILSKTLSSQMSHKKKKKFVQRFKRCSRSNVRRRARAYINPLYQLNKIQSYSNPNPTQLNPP